MLPGLSGHLVSDAVLERAVVDAVPALAAPGLESGRARLGRWRHLCRWLGPASTVPSLFEAAAAPLVDALGFDVPSRVERAGGCVLATIHAGPEPVVLLVSAWAERLDPFWRLAITEAMRRAAAWALLFNGTHLRLVDADRLYARRFAEFDVDLVIDQERTFAAFWALMYST